MFARLAVVWGPRAAEVGLRTDWLAPAIVAGALWRVP
jgi:hypothetical protein